MHAAVVGSCHVERGASTAVGTPTYRGNSQTTYSCVANDNCNYDVHFISNYLGIFSGHHTGTIRVHLNVTGQSTKPLILVLSSYEPTDWILTIPSGVTVYRAIMVRDIYNQIMTFPHHELVSHLLPHIHMQITFYPSHNIINDGPGQVLQTEKVDYMSITSSTEEADEEGGNTVRTLQYLTDRFGPVSSFSASRRADSWAMNIRRHNTSGSAN